ncbi:MAG: hypothetical protein RIC55_26035 [Pirellulaceae bacterium]
MKTLRRLWRDEAGFVLSTEMTMVASVLVLGLTAGVVSVRDQLVQELADVSMAISSYNQSYSFSAVTTCTASSAGTHFRDTNDFCDEDEQNPVGFPTMCAAVDCPVDEEQPLEGV